jgi:hypothetical protein
VHSGFDYRDKLIIHLASSIFSHRDSAIIVIFKLIRYNIYTIAQANMHSQLHLILIVIMFNHMHDTQNIINGINWFIDLHTPICQ